MGKCALASICAPRRDYLQDANTAATRADLSENISVASEQPPREGSFLLQLFFGQAKKS